MGFRARLHVMLEFSGFLFEPSNIVLGLYRLRVRVLLVGHCGPNENERWVGGVHCVVSGIRSVRGECDVRVLRLSKYLSFLILINIVQSKVTTHKHRNKQFSFKRGSWIISIYEYEYIHTSRVVCYIRVLV